MSIEVAGTCTARCPNVLPPLRWSPSLTASQLIPMCGGGGGLLRLEALFAGAHTFVLGDTSSTCVGVAALFLPRDQSDHNFVSSAVDAAIRRKMCDEVGGLIGSAPAPNLPRRLRPRSVLPTPARLPRSVECNRQPRGGCRWGRVALSLRLHYFSHLRL